jgi:hypothetical protein
MPSSALLVALLLAKEKEKVQTNDVDMSYGDDAEEETPTDSLHLPSFECP